MILTRLKEYSKKAILIFNSLEINKQKWLMKDNKWTRIDPNKGNGHFSREKFLKNTKLYWPCWKKSLVKISKGKTTKRKINGDDCFYLLGTYQNIANQSNFSKDKILYIVPNTLHDLFITNSANRIKYFAFDFPLRCAAYWSFWKFYNIAKWILKNFFVWFLRPLIKLVVSP